MTRENKDTATTLFLAWGVPPERIRQALAVAAGEMEYSAPAQTLGRVVRPKDAARALGVTTKTIARRVADGRLRAVYSGKGDKRRMVGITVASINAFIQGGEGTEVEA